MYKILSEIQSELNAPKTLFNKFGNYYYRSAETILEAIKPLLKKHNVSLIIDDEIILIGERYYIKATATLYGEKGTIISHAYAREDESKKGMDSSQLTGSTSSYARKYALNGLFAIDDNKDQDTNEFNAQNSQNETTSQPKQASTSKESKSVANTPKRTADEVKEMFFKVGGDKATEEVFLKWTDDMIAKGLTTDQMYSILTGKQ